MCRNEFLYYNLWYIYKSQYEATVIKEITCTVHDRYLLSRGRETLENVHKDSLLAEYYEIAITNYQQYFTK